MEGAFMKVSNILAVAAATLLSMNVALAADKIKSAKNEAECTTAGGTWKAKDAKNKKAHCVKSEGATDTKASSTAPAPEAAPAAEPATK
jgi:hypothetical protein